MATFITLVELTDAGAKNIRNLTENARANFERADRLGVTIVGWYLTQGEYDIVVVAEAPDAETMLAYTIELAAIGRGRTQTLRAFTMDDVEHALERIR